MNKNIIYVFAGLFILSSIFLVLNKKALSGITIILTSVFMMATKDNFWIKSDVSAINRESKDRLEWFITDISFIGVALILLGGMG